MSKLDELRINCSSCGAHLRLSDAEKQAIKDIAVEYIGPDDTKEEKPASASKTFQTGYNMGKQHAREGIDLL